MSRNSSDGLIFYCIKNISLILPYERPALSVPAFFLTHYFFQFGCFVVPYIV